MQRQVVTTDEHGRTVWKWVDCGPAKVEQLRGAPIVPRTAARPTAAVSTGRKAEGGQR